MPSSSFNVDRNRSPDAVARGFCDSLRLDEDDALCSFHFGFQEYSFHVDVLGCVTIGFLMVLGTSNRSPDAWLGFSDLWRRFASFLEQRSVVSFSDDALLPARNVIFFWT